MKKYTDAVHEFHTAFGLGIKNEPTADLGVAKNLLRFNLMKEENEEYLEAANANDLVEVADALGDAIFWMVPLEKASKQIYSAIQNKKRVAYISKRWFLIALVLKIMPAWVLKKIL